MPLNTYKSNATWTLAFTLFLAALACIGGGIRLEAPAEGTTVTQLWPEQAQLVRETRIEREKYFDGAANAKSIKGRKGAPKPVEFLWSGGKPPYRFTIRRLPDGKVFHDATVEVASNVVDSLEIAREWEWTVSDGKGTASGRFRTEDRVPRLIRIDGVPNARDVGGWIGMDGRRIRQGLLFRTSGLNNNAPIEYYSLAEIKKLHAEGKLVGMGEVGKRHARQLDRGEKLRESDMRLIKRSCFAPGTERLAPEERNRVLRQYGFKTDIDLRKDSEIYGMTESPLGPSAAWVNVPLIGGYGAFANDLYFDCKRKIFGTIFDTNSYPVVFHCIGGADRTGTIAFMIEALLGVDENTLALDYLLTGLAGGITDAKHKAWFDSMVKTLRDLPGYTNAEKMNGVFLRMGFTQKEIDGFREFMLEPKPATIFADRAASSSFTPGEHGALDGTFSFASGKSNISFHGFDVVVDKRIIWRGTNGWPLVDVKTERDGSGGWTLTHLFERNGERIPATAKITFEDEIMRIAWSMPGVERDMRGEPRFTMLSPGWFDRPVKRLYWGFGNVAEDPVKFRTSGGGSSLSTRHAGADFDGGISLVQATSVLPLYMTVDREKKRFQLESQHDTVYTFIPSAQGAFAAARRFGEVCGYGKGAGVDLALGKMCLDKWGGTQYGRDTGELLALARYGVTDAIFLKHTWQNHGYDVQLPDIWPPRGDEKSFAKMVKTAKNVGMMFGLHDNYIDFYTNATGFGWNLVAHDAKGKPQKAFFNPNTKQQSFRFRPDAIEPFLRRNMRYMREGVAPDALFIDVFTSVRPYDGYDAEGRFFPSTFTAAKWGEAFDIARSELGVTNAVMVSEAGHDWLIGHVDAAECDHYPASRLIGPGNFSDAVRVPWMDIATHGRFVLLGGGLGFRYCAPAWRQDGDNVLHGYGSDDYLCTTVIGGRNPMGEGCPSRRTVATYWLLHDTCAGLAKGDFRSFIFEDGDIHRQHSRFSSGEVWANVSTNGEWVVDGRVLPPYGFYARSDGAEAGIVRQDGQRIAYSTCGAVRFLDARPDFLPDSNKRYNHKGREKELELNLSRRMMDFGGIRTDGAFRLDMVDAAYWRSSSSWKITPLPDSLPFKAEFDFAALNRPSAKVREVIVDDADKAADAPKWRQEGKVLYVEADAKAAGYRIIFHEDEAALFRKMPWRLGENGLFSLSFKDGKVVCSGTCGRKTEKTAIGYIYCYDHPRACVTVECARVEGGWDMRGTVVPRGESPLLEFNLPARLRFDGGAVDRFTVPLPDNMGPGMAFNSRFFDMARAKTDKTFYRTRRYKVDYPTAFADFMHMSCTNGKHAAIFSVQPRPPHEPWKMPAEHRFVPGSLSCGVDAAGGWLEHKFVTYVTSGEAWRTPRIRVVTGKPLAAALEEYAKENTLTKTLAEKVPDATLRKRLAEAPFIVFSYSSPCADIREAVKCLPPGTHIRNYGYMKGGFDKQYPDFLPPREKFGTAKEFRELIDEIHRLGHLFSPYTNPTFWCDNPRGETFLAKGEAPLAVGLDGRRYHETYGKADGWMTTLWHPAVRAANEKTRRQFTEEYPVDLLFEDQHGARKFKYDMNPAAPSPRDYTEGIISLCEEGSRLVPLGTENGWDKVANEMTMLEGMSFYVYPSARRPKYVTSLKREYPPELWNLELIPQRLFHGKLIFKHHDNGQLATDDKTIAWSLALGYIMHWGVNAREYVDDPTKREWFAKLAAIQRDVVAPLVGRKLTGFKHDRSAIFRDGYDPVCEDDDGYVVAEYEGGMRLTVNLGHVERTVGSRILGPYGYVLDRNP